MRMKNWFKKSDTRELNGFKNMEKGEFLILKSKKCVSDGEIYDMTPM